MTTKAELEKRIAVLTAEMIRYDEGLSHLADLSRKLSMRADELNVALKDAAYWRKRANFAENRVAELEAQLRAMMEGEAYGWMRSHPEIDAAIDESFESTVDSTEE